MNDKVPSAREYWNDRYKKHGNNAKGPSAFLVRTSYLLPYRGLALDIGCGGGENAAFLAKDLDVVAMDVSDKAIEMASALVAREGVASRVTLVLGDSRELLVKEPDNKYELVASINYFEPAIVPAMKRLLKPGGTVVIQAYTEHDERLSQSPRTYYKLPGETTFFQPDYFGGYWILVHEVEDFVDEMGRQRQRVNMIARKPF
nr:class I SAM-dependent methyltransferase [Candidatus Sigynarchaeota archaeon]